MNKKLKLTFGKNPFEED